MTTDEITYDELMQYSVIRYGTPDGFYLDIMTRIGEAADYYSIKREKKNRRCYNPAGLGRISL